MTKKEKEERRDVFAAFALMGLLASPRIVEINGRETSAPIDVATAAFSYADAMLTESEKEQV